MECGPHPWHGPKPAGAAYGPGQAPLRPRGEKEMTEQMTNRRIGTRDEWLAARERLLVREKEHTRFGDELAQLRRELPWGWVEKENRFDTDDGERALGELFDGRSQLLVYHFT